MVDRAREHAAEEGIENASYTVGRAENIPEKSGLNEHHLDGMVLFSKGTKP